MHTLTLVGWCRYCRRRRCMAIYVTISNYPKRVPTLIRGTQNTLQSVWISFLLSCVDVLPLESCSTTRETLHTVNSVAIECDMAIQLCFCQMAIPTNDSYVIFDQNLRGVQNFLNLPLKWIWIIGHTLEPSSITNNAHYNEGLVLLGGSSWRNLATALYSIM